MSILRLLHVLEIYDKIKMLIGGTKLGLLFTIPMVPNFLLQREDVNDNKLKGKQTRL